MAIKLVVFDMAGTTVKDDHYVALAFQQAMDNFGYTLDLKLINPIMGYKKPVAIDMMLQKYEADKEKITPRLITDIHDVFVKNMLNFYRNAEISALPHVEDTFAALRDMGIKIGLDTGFSKNIADLIFERLNWKNKVDFMVASDEVPQGRPYPYMINKMMAALNLTDAGEVAKVGDTEVDINEGKNAGCRYIIGVTTGSFTREELAVYQPTHIIDDIAEVLTIINTRKGFFLISTKKLLPIGLLLPLLYWLPLQLLVVTPACMLSEKLLLRLLLSINSF